MHHPFLQTIIKIIIALLSIQLLSCDSGTEPKTDPMTLSFVSDHASYLEATDGSIDLTVTGGNPPYSYLWSTGAITEDIEQLPAAVYSVTVTDADQVQLTDSIQITEPSNVGRVTDIDGNVYKTIKIGDQWWMAENLRVTHDSQGNPIESRLYDNDPNNEIVLGRLYTWNVAMDSSTSSGTQGIAPSDWHIPSTTDWGKLIDFLGGQAIAGGKMKQTGLTSWNPPNTSATNSSGFTVLAAGEWEGVYQFKGKYALFWTSNAYGLNDAYYYYLSKDNASITRRTWKKDLAYSVRCVKD